MEIAEDDDADATVQRPAHPVHDDASTGVGAATGQLGVPLHQSAKLPGGASEWPVSDVSSQGQPAQRRAGDLPIAGVIPRPPPLPGGSLGAPPPSAGPAPTARSASPTGAPSRPADPPAADPPAVAPAPRPRASQPAPARPSRPAPASLRAVAPASVPPAAMASRLATAANPSAPDASRDAAAAKLQRVEQALRRTEERVTQLTQRLETMDEQLRAAERGIADKQQELDRLASQHDSARSLIAVRAERMRELESQIADRDRKVRSFDEQIVALSQQHEATVGRLQREHAEALARATAAARPPDDLKQLHGIGPKFERLLHAAGIRRFAQIAGWTRQDVATVAERLGIRPGRIERDNWVESARRLLGDGGD